MLKSACVGMLLCPALPSALQAGVKRINSADGSFSVAVPEDWRGVNYEEGPVVGLEQSLSGKVVIRRGVTPFDPAVMAAATVKRLGYVESCDNRTDYPYGRSEEWSPLLISTISLRRDWPAAYAVTGGCGVFDLPAIFFSDGSVYSIARCRFSDLKACAETAASIGPPVAKEKPRAVPAARFKVLGLGATLPSAACRALNGFDGVAGRGLTLLIYTIVGIPVVVFFYVFSMLFYQSVAAGSLLAFLAGWLLYGRPRAVRRLLFFAVLTGLLFSWDSANVPYFGLRYNPHGEICAAVAEGWLSSALVILAGWLGFFARGRYEGRSSGSNRH